MPLMCSMKAARKAFVNLKWSEIVSSFTNARDSSAATLRTMRWTLSKTSQGALVPRLLLRKLSGRHQAA